MSSLVEKKKVHSNRGSQDQLLTKGLKEIGSVRVLDTQNIYQSRQEHLE